MKLKNILKPILPLSILILMLAPSCEELGNMGTENIRDNIEGQWQCDETSEYYKSTAQIYEVYIYPHPDDSTLVFIENFYGLTNDVSVIAKVSSRNLFINTQTVGEGFTITGSGTISSNFNNINWSYSVDDGSGKIDNVTATYTKL
jgi:hypothetical protein